MITPTYKPRMRWTGVLWRCRAPGGNSGWGDTPELAYADWIKKLRLDGLYWEFFA